MKIKKYTQFLKEEVEIDTDLPENTIENEEELDKENSNYDEVTEELKKMIESTICKSGGEYNQFISSFIKDSDNVKIEGLINESDIYDFYLKFRNQVDEILNDTKFYQQTPDENGCLGLYDYVILGTNKAILEFAKLLGK
jgi:hypothetical protein